MPSEYTKPVPASSSFHSENSGKALPSLYAQQSPCLYPAHSSLFPGNQTQLLPGRLLSSVRSLLRGTGVPHHSPPSQVLSRPRCQGTLAVSTWPVHGVLAWERTLSPLESCPISGVPRTYWICISARLVTLWRTQEPAMPSIWAVLCSGNCKAHPLARDPFALTGPGGCGCIPHTSAPPLLALLLFRFGLHPVFPPIVLLALFSSLS